MEQQARNTATVRRMGDYYSVAWRRVRASRPFSYYLLLAMPVFLLVGAPIARALHDPRALFWFLTVNLLFFFAVMVAAVRDFRKIARGYFTEREQVYRNTLGDTDFAEQLGQRVAERRLP